VFGFQRLKAEVLPWHQKVSTLRSLAEKLIDGYCNDDSSKVRATVGRLDHRWTTLLHRCDSPSISQSSALLFCVFAEVDYLVVVVVLVLDLSY